MPYPLGCAYEPVGDDGLSALLRALAASIVRNLSSSNLHLRFGVALRMISNHGD